MTEIATKPIRGDSPTCPTCNYAMNSDDMNANSEDLWAIAPNEERVVIECPSCGIEYHCQGGYKPEYTSALSEDEL